ncbi:MAG: hypothetical protein ACPHUL_00315 [Marinomonas gallaica]
MLKQINDILTNGNAATAAERIHKLVKEEYSRSTAIRARVERIALQDGVEPENMTPNELVDLTTTQKIKKSDLILSVLVGVNIGALVTYFFWGSVS